MRALAQEYPIDSFYIWDIYGRFRNFVSNSALVSTIHIPPVERLQDYWHGKIRKQKLSFELWDSRVFIYPS
jgi:hypothetical protein